MKSISHSVTSAGLRTSSNSIGVLRYGLALLIVLHHMNGLLGIHIPLLLQPDIVVSAFFVLSGFFAWQSMRRPVSYVQFVRHRLSRLLPVYWVVIVCSAIGLSVVSDMTYGDYFSSRQFWSYLLANTFLLNFLQPELPGVFSDHLIQAVNGSLWYVKLEVLFTLLAPLIIRTMQTVVVRMSHSSSSVLRCSWGGPVVLLSVWLTSAAAGFAVGCSNGLIPQQVFSYWGYFLMFVSGMILSLLFTTGKILWSFPVFLFFTLVLFVIFVGRIHVGLATFPEFLGAVAVIWMLILCFLSVSWGASCNANNMTYCLYLGHFPLIQLALSLTSGLIPALGLSVCLLTVCIPLLYYGVERRIGTGKIQS